MKNNIEKAKEILKKDGCTLAVCRDGEIIKSEERGIKPLLELYDKGKSLEGFSAADKVVGKAAAFIYVFLKPSEVYAEILSERALGVLENNGIKASYGILVPSVQNRTNTGICPMEQTVWDIDSPEAALTAIRRKLAEMQK